MHEIVLKENLRRLKEERRKEECFYQRLWFENEMETFKVARGMFEKSWRFFLS
jgi:hypothetical protein